ncbi:CAP domain-containing protein [Nonomuraea sp. NPDC005983]|uniref:CAP domain-containing protein n=1 Tax=Nonomuraea sp. NPDC005983 TaxID=3155595 RepID=UPI0033B8A63A
MWQSFLNRHTQRSARRRNHLGALACLMAALFTGVLLGRLSDTAEPTGHVYLNETAPPAAALKAVPTPKKSQQHAGRVAREITTAVPRGRVTSKPTRRPTGEVPGFTAEDPTQVLGGQPVEALPAMASQVVTLTNTARVEQGCRRLRVDSRLTRSARTHSLEMARTGRFSHDSPDGSSPWDRMERAGYGLGAAENIGRGYSSPQEAVDAWLASPDHRKNILNCRLGTIGVGVVTGPGGPWWTQDFGYP